MAKKVTRLKALFTGPRTARELSEAFLLVAKSTPRRTDAGAFSFRRDGFTLRFLITPDAVRVYGSTLDAEEFLWFEGRFSDLPHTITRKLRPLLPRRSEPLPPPSIFATEDVGPAVASPFRATLWFKEKREAEERARFLSNAARNRQATRGTGNDEFRSGRRLGHSTDLE